MSYILDAIKKSEEERGQGSIPGLQTVHSSSLNYKSERNPIWPYFVIGLLLLNVIGLTIYFFSNSSPQPIQTPDSLATLESLPEPVTKPAQITNTQMNKISIQPPVIASTQSQNTIEENTNSQNINSNEILSIEELPFDIKSNIPSLTFNGHVYSSSAKQRSIILNGNFMEEGDFVTQELIVLEITSKGAIFNYQGTLFKVNVLTGWNVN